MEIVEERHKIIPFSVTCAMIIIAPTTVIPKNMLYSIKNIEAITK
ncbi:MAG TPA: hypothetical protein VFT83_04525 [Nitrososphaeraceae archaeon]|nr:hypothetical protein [Nitrososphaeraceae archaeon]